MAKELLGITEAHVRIPLEVLQSPAFIALPASAVKLYVDMLSHLRSLNNGNLNATFSELRHRGWRSPTTLAKALRQLEAAGLIAKTRATIGVRLGSKVCNLYRFTDRVVYEQKGYIGEYKETRDYRKLQTLKDAKRAVAVAAPPKRKNKTSLQKLERHDTESVAIGRFNATDSVVTPSALTTESVASGTPKNRANQRPARVPSKFKFRPNCPKATTETVHLT